VPLVGASGRYLRGVMAKAGLDLDRDCRRTNAVRCRPPGNRVPKPKELKTCAPLWEAEVDGMKPKVVLLLGNAALTAWMQGRWRKDLHGIGCWRGFAIPDRERRCWVVPTYHPSFLLRRGGESHGQEDPAEPILRKDIELAVACLGRPFPEFRSSCVDLVKAPLDIVRRLVGLREGKAIAIDYETTGLKPHAEGHRILSCAISTEDDKAFAFPMESRRVRGAVGKVMANPAIPKVAANIQFENEWSRVCLGVETLGWEWDTMLAAHVLDNRPHISSLKFQAAVRWGILDYDSTVAPFMDSDWSEGANTKNRMDQVPLDDLLHYNGMDALLERRLWLEQRKEVGR